MPPSDLLQTLANLHVRGDRFVSVTMIDAKGSVPQEIGAKMLANRDGRICGTVGGGRLEEAALRLSAELLHDAAPASPCRIQQWNLQSDIGMTCGGIVTLLFEIFHQNPWNIVIFGAGHVAQALVRLLATLKCRVTLYDSRPEQLSALPPAPNLFPHQQQVLEEAVPDLPENAFVLLMTQGHRTDRPVLERILKTRHFPYLGVIGSASKAAVLRKELREAGVDKAEFRCPIGLPLGGNSPEEIAVSIAAELLQVRG